MKPGSGSVVLAVLLAAGCAVRVGGPKPENADAVAIHVDANATADQVAQLLTQHGVEYAILSASRDSTFFTQVATQIGLKTTRPGHAGSTTFAFLGPQAIGDTTLTLKVPGGGEVRLHDALYRVDKNRRLDLMAVQIQQDANLKESIRTLLGYIATDVLANAAVLLAIEPPTPALGDSVSILTRAAFADLWECTREGRDHPTNRDLPIRVFYGPTARMSCQEAERIGDNTLLGHFVLPR